MGEKVMASRATASQQGGSHHSYGGSVEEQRQSSAFTRLLTMQQLSLAQFPVCLHSHTELCGQVAALLPQRPSYEPDSASSRRVAQVRRLEHHTTKVALQISLAPSCSHVLVKHENLDRTRVGQPVTLWLWLSHYL